MPENRTTRVTPEVLEPEIEAIYRREGERAAREGQEAHDCPYAPMTAAALAWLHGWCFA